MTGSCSILLYGVSFFITVTASVFATFFFAASCTALTVNSSPLANIISRKEEHFITHEGYGDRLLIVAPDTASHAYNVIAFVRRPQNASHFVIGHATSDLVIVVHRKPAAAGRSEQNQHEKRY